jgi:hypothetical protein
VRNHEEKRININDHPNQKSKINKPRVPVVNARGVPLTPCTPARARILLKRDKTVAKWSRLGIFYIKLKYLVEPNNKTLAIDPELIAKPSSI